MIIIFTQTFAILNIILCKSMLLLKLNIYSRFNIFSLDYCSVLKSYLKVQLNRK